MTQFFNRQEAEMFAHDVREQFPQLRVDGIHNISDKETGEYHYSYFSVWFGNEHLFHTYISCQEDWNIFLVTCQYIASAVAGNQQSEEVERGRSFTDQNGFTVLQGCNYGIDEYGNLYDLESHESFKPSEY